MLQEPNDERRTVEAQFQIVALIAAAVLGIGTIFYHYVEKLNWIDALYFCTVTLTTIGYGDIVPHTTAGKLFTVLYVFVGIGIIAAFANLLLKRAAIRHQHPNE